MKLFEQLDAQSAAVLTELDALKDLSAKEAKVTVDVSQLEPKGSEG